MFIATTALRTTMVQFVVPTKPGGQAMAKKAGFVQPTVKATSTMVMLMIVTRRTKEG